MTKTLTLDDYVLATLMPDLVGHDRSPAAFLVYLYLWSRTVAVGARSAAISHAGIADDTGLSKSAVQAALRLLRRRGLVTSRRLTPTSTPEHAVRRPWLRRATS